MLFEEIVIRIFYFQGHNRTKYDQSSIQIEWRMGKLYDHSFNLEESFDINKSFFFSSFFVFERQHNW